MTLKSDVRETFRIIDCTDMSELDALHPKDRALYDMFISAKVINLMEGSAAREKLWEMFPEGTTTGDNLRNYENGLCPPPPDPEDE